MGQTSPTTQQSILSLFSQFVTAQHQDKLRSLSEFAETLRLPAGPYAGMKFRFARLPYGKLLYEAIESGKWQRFAIVGPVQGGKTWHSIVIPTLYYLFEHKENVIFGLPNIEMSQDKWSVDLAPVILSSGFKGLLPEKGGGSRGGDVDLIKFKNGTRLKFMPGSGNDAKRSGYSSKIIVITECDKMDDIVNSSDEAAPLKQIENRAGAFEASEQRIFMECTVSHVKGHIWQEYSNGTASKLYHKCPNCGEYVSIEREQLQGWQSAENELEAGENSHFVCPLCEHVITEEERVTMNAYENTRLVHKGQAVDKDGNISGEEPPTRTLGFRWNAFENLLKTTSEFGCREWKALRAEDIISSEREMKQFVWATPCDDSADPIKKLSAQEIQKRREKGLPRGLCPKGTLFISAGIDIGIHHCWSTYIAWTRDDPTAPLMLRGHIIAYENWKLDKERYTDDEASVDSIRQALEAYTSFYEYGFPVFGGGFLPIMYAGIDSGYKPEVVYDFCRKRNFKDCYPLKGFGMSERKPNYYKPKRRTSMIDFIGNNYHISKILSAHTYLIETNSDYWKSQVRDRMSVDVSNPQSLILYDSPNLAEHSRYITHLMAEEPVLKRESTGDKIVWQTAIGSRANHWFDATAYACMMGSFCNTLLMQRSAVASVVQNVPEKEDSNSIYSSVPDNWF